jgi:hypothetical protein
VIDDVHEVGVHSPVDERPHRHEARALEALARNGRLWTCRLIDLEVVYGSRPRDVADIIEERRALPSAPIDRSVMDRAVQVAGRLARSGQHRGAKPVDLVIAAAAEAAGLSVLHYDSDYDRIAAVTNQPTEWIAPAGILD